VTVAVPVEQDVTDHVDFTGKTAAVESVQLRARVGGYLQKVEYTEGDKVEKDQKLFEIDDRPYKAELDHAKARVKSAQTNLREAETVYQRNLRLRQTTPGAVSPEDVEKSLRTRDVAAADLEAAQANVRLKELNLGFTGVLSPIKGRADKADTTLGNLVSSSLVDATILTNVVRLDPMYAYFNVDELTLFRILKMEQEGKLAPREKKTPRVFMGLGIEPPTTDRPLLAGHAWSLLAQGQSLQAMPAGPAPFLLSVAQAAIMAGGERDYPFRGVIDFVANQVDPSMGTITVRGNFPNKDGFLRPGLFVRIRVPLGDPHPALLVSDRALGTNQGQKFLYVLDDKNKVEYRPVTVGGLHDGLREIVDGLKAGERVVVNGLLRVRPGVTVAPKSGQMRPEPAEKKQR
jgi:multidrug efflux pump subunit AcrA (membrane-fusion protein)